MVGTLMFRVWERDVRKITNLTTWIFIFEHAMLIFVHSTCLLIHCHWSIQAIDSLFLLLFINILEQVFGQWQETLNIRLELRKRTRPSGGPHMKSPSFRALQCMLIRKKIIEWWKGLILSLKLHNIGWIFWPFILSISILGLGFINIEIISRHYHNPPYRIVTLALTSTCKSTSHQLAEHATGSKLQGSELAPSLVFLFLNFYYWPRHFVLFFIFYNVSNGFYSVLPKLQRLSED